jgi:hypothetical protein
MQIIRFISRGISHCVAGMSSAGDSCITPAKKSGKCHIGVKLLTLTGYLGATAIPFVKPERNRLTFLATGSDAPYAPGGVVQQINNIWWAELFCAQRLVQLA